MAVISLSGIYLEIGLTWQLIKIYMVPLSLEANFQHLLRLSPTHRLLLYNHQKFPIQGNSSTKNFNFLAKMHIFPFLLLRKANGQTEKRLSKKGPYYRLQYSSTSAFQISPAFEVAETHTAEERGKYLFSQFDT